MPIFRGNSQLFEGVLTGAERPREVASNPIRNCGDWRDPMGSADVDPPNRVDHWFYEGSAACSYPGRVYCLEH